MAFEELDRRAYVLKSFDSVGPEKAVGYLPLPAIRKILNESVSDIKNLYIQRWLNCIEFSEQETCIKGGALFVYDEIAFKKILDRFNFE